jgi:hypothetical protein
MTITQHAHIYNFHILNFIFGQIIFLKFLSKPPLTQSPKQEFLRVSGAFLDKELLVCNIAVGDATYVTLDIEIVYYYLPIIEDRQWEDLNNRMGLIESLTNQEGPLKADPYKEVFATSNNKKTDDAGLNDFLKLQEKVSKHDRQINELMTSHLEDQQRSVQAETKEGKWDPQEMGTHKQANKMVTSNHGPAYSPKIEYGLGTKNMIASMNMLKRSDMWIADSGASNHVTFSVKGCRNKRVATGLTHRIVGESVLPKCELDIPCIHCDKDGTQVGEVIITDVSHLPEGTFNLFSLKRLQKKGWTLLGNEDYIKLQNGGNPLLFNIVVSAPKGAQYVGKFSRTGGDEVMRGATNKSSYLQH